MSTELKSSFIDASGQTWVVQLNYAAVRRVHARTSVLLTDIFDASSESHKAFVSDQFLPLDCLCELLSGDMAQRGVTEEQFLERINNEQVVIDAIQSLEHAVLNFFQPSRRAVLV